MIKTIQNVVHNLYDFFLHVRQIQLSWHWDLHIISQFFDLSTRWRITFSTSTKYNLGLIENSGTEFWCTGKSQEIRNNQQIDPFWNKKSGYNVTLIKHFISLRQKTLETSKRYLIGSWEIAFHTKTIELSRSTVGTKDSLLSRRVQPHRFQIKSACVCV